MNRSDNLALEQLKSFIERIEKLEEERTALGADIREVYSEAKGAGFDVKPLRIVIKRRKMEPAERNEQDEIVDIYEQAVNGRPVVEEARAARDDRCRALLAEGKSVRQVETLTGVPKSEVQRIRADLAGEIRKDVSQSLGQQEPTPSPTPMEATGGVAHKAANGTRDGAAQAGTVNPHSQQPPARSDSDDDLSQSLGQSIEDEVPQPEPVVAAVGDASALERDAKRLFQGGKVTVEFGGKVYGAGNVDEFKDDLPRFLDRALWSKPGTA